jgi:hypothetical protein
MNRREFVKALGGAGAAALSQGVSLAADAGNLTFCAPLTHSDWMLKPNMKWGEEGVRHMLDVCKASGLSHVFWRTADAGQATYASKVMRPGLRAEADSIFSPRTDEGKEAVRKLLPNLTAEQSRTILEKMTGMDYGTFDSLAAAVKYGHLIGLKVHAWVTINEDDHGWGWRSEFCKAHPEYRWVRRDGRVYHSQLSFAYPEVRAYKLSILTELLEGYDLDGFFLDWIRTGDIRDNPQNDAAGLADYGYEGPSVERFKAQTGKDPHDVPPDDETWARVRAEPVTRFMREARKLISARKLPLAVMVGHPWHYRGAVDRIAGNLKGLLLDVATWAKEGLIDSVVPAGYYRDGGDGEKAYRAVKEETGGKVEVWPYAWVPQNVGEVEQAVELTKKLGARRVLFWEADYLDDRAGEVRERMRQVVR